jgi:hypothetical protein
MTPDEPRAIRKHLIAAKLAPSLASNELDLRSFATVYFSSEQAAHPILHLFDGTVGPGATKWVAGRRDVPETVLLVFDEPSHLTRCSFEAEEREAQRTQCVRADYLFANEEAYRQSFNQEFNFSRDGATFQHELIGLDLRAVMRFRLTILADKSGRGVASLTSLRLFGA